MQSLKKIHGCAQMKVLLSSGAALGAGKAA